MINDVHAVLLRTEEPSVPALGPFDNGSRFSEVEREHRWSRVRTLLAEQELDGVIVFASGADGALLFAEWLIDGLFRNPGAVFFPASGAPVAFGVASTSHPWVLSEALGDADLAVGLGGAVESLLAPGAAIGTVGADARVTGLNEFTDQGLATWGTFDRLRAGHPSVTFHDITAAFARAMAVKSDEEIAAARGAAEQGEELHELIVGALEPGVTSRGLRSLLWTFFTTRDIIPDVQAIEMPTDRPLREGDLVNTEFGLHYRGGYAQVTLAAHLGEPSDAVRDLAEHAQRLLDQLESTMIPRRPFAEVLAPLQESIDDAGRWHGFPLLHSLSPLSLVGRLAVPGPAGMPITYSPPLGADEVLQEDSLFSLEVGVRSGPVAQVKIGGTAVLRASGLEPLNTRGRTLQVIR